MVRDCWINVPFPPRLSRRWVSLSYGESGVMCDWGCRTVFTVVLCMGCWTHLSLFSLSYGESRRVMKCLRLFPNVFVDLPLLLSLPPSSPLSAQAGSRAYVSPLPSGGADVESDPQVSSGRSDGDPPADTLDQRCSYFRVNTSSRKTAV